jgi:redox-sensing transcriptional repressor
MSSELNKNLVTRLVKYQRVLRKLKTLGLVNVFSNNLADAIGVSPTVVRKDFSLINIPGNKRGGYNIDNLIEDIGRIIGIQADKPVILVGAGRIGQALMNYHEFPKEGIRIVAAFDSNPDRHVPDSAIPILPMNRLPEFVRSHSIEIGIIAVPESSATQVFNDMISAGIKGFLNFTAAELKCHGRCLRPECPHPCVISSVNIGLELENLFYLVGAKLRPGAGAA